MIHFPATHQRKFCWNLHCIWSQNLKPTKALLRKAQALSDITAWPISCQQKGAGVSNWILPVTGSSFPAATWLFLCLCV